METGRLLEESINPINHTRISNKLTWTLPVNPSVNNYEYKTVFHLQPLLETRAFLIIVYL